MKTYTVQYVRYHEEGSTHSSFIVIALNMKDAKEKAQNSCDNKDSGFGCYPTKITLNY